MATNELFWGRLFIISRKSNQQITDNPIPSKYFWQHGIYHFVLYTIIWIWMYVVASLEKRLNRLLINTSLSIWWLPDNCLKTTWHCQMPLIFYLNSTKKDYHSKLCYIEIKTLSVILKRILNVITLFFVYVLSIRFSFVKKNTLFLSHN